MIFFCSDFETHFTGVFFYDSNHFLTFYPLWRRKRIWFENFPSSKNFLFSKLITFFAKVKNRFLFHKHILQTLIFSGLILVNDLPLKSGQNWLFGSKRCTMFWNLWQQFSDICVFYFLRNDRFYTQNTWRIDLNESPKMAKKNVPKMLSQKMRNVLKPMQKQFCDFLTIFL